MKPRPFFAGVIAVSLAAGLAGLAWQYHTNAGLQHELTRRRQQVDEQARLAAEHRRLEAEQISPAELAERQEARATLAALASEIELARRRAGAAPAARPPDGTPAPRPSLREASMVAEEWTNAGDREATAAVETALWASAHGDLETLAGLLVMSEAARRRAAELFAALPAALRGEVRTPEQLVAALTANAVPLGSAQVVAQFTDAAVTRLAVQLNDGEGGGRQVLLSLQETDGHWRLLVPDAALAGYLKELQKPAGRFALPTERVE